jgi:hypothetical protein
MLYLGLGFATTCNKNVEFRNSLFFVKVEAHTAC